MKKKHVLFILVLMSVMLTVGCGKVSADSEIMTPSVLKEGDNLDDYRDIDILYVEEGVLKTKTEKLVNHPEPIVIEWLKQNDLDGKYEYASTSFGYIDITGEELEEIVGIEWDSFVEYKEWDIYFLSDFSAFLDAEGNELYREAFNKTLEQAYKAWYGDD